MIHFGFADRAVAIKKTSKGRSCFGYSSQRRVRFVLSSEPPRAAQARHDDDADMIFTVRSSIPGGVGGDANDSGEGVSGSWEGPPLNKMSGFSNSTFCVLTSVIK